MNPPLPPANAFEVGLIPPLPLPPPPHNFTFMAVTEEGTVQVNVPGVVNEVSMLGINIGGDVGDEVGPTLGNEVGS